MSSGEFMLLALLVVLFLAAGCGELIAAIIRRIIRRTK